MAGIMMIGIQELARQNEELQARLEALERTGGAISPPAGPFSFNGPVPWLLFGGLALGGMVTGLTARNFWGKLR